MLYLCLKAALTGVVVVAISEISKRSSMVAAILASLPLTSILAFIWMYIDNRNEAAIRQLSYGIFWLILPSCAFFLLLPAFLKAGLAFYPSLLSACLGTAVFYAGYLRVLRIFHIEV